MRHHSTAIPLAAETKFCTVRPMAWEKFQTAEGTEEILTIAAQQLGHLLERDLVVYQADGNGGLLPAMSFPFSEEADMSSLLTPAEEAVAEWVYKNNKHAGATTNTLPNSKCLYLSIRGTGGALAVVGISVKGEHHPLFSFEKNLMVALLDECGLALEKEITMREKQKAEAQANQENLRANLLRAISHDLRTPLTSISSNANILMESADQLEPEKKQSLFTAIYDDAMWLIDLVENLLSITRIEDNRINMNMEPEMISDIFTEAMAHLDRNASKHHIKAKLDDDMLVADMDARLMVQVVINIVNNAIKYTPEGSNITLSARKSNQMVIVEIADDGPGIPDASKDKLFDMHVAFLQAVCYNNEKICKTYCRSQQSFRGTAAVCAHPLRPHTYKPRSVFPEAHVLGKKDFMRFPPAGGMETEAEPCITVRSKTATSPTARASG